MLSATVGPVSAISFHVGLMQLNRVDEDTPLIIAHFGKDHLREDLNISNVNTVGFGPVH